MADRRKAREELLESSRRELYPALVMILAGAAILLVIGLTMVYSATAPSAIRAAHARGLTVSYGTALRQALYAGVGVALAAGIAVSAHFRRFAQYANIIFIAAVILQLLVLSPLGHAVSGNNNWLRLGSIQIQPSEFLKLAMILWLGVALGTPKKNDWAWRDVFSPSWIKQEWAGSSAFPPVYGAVVAMGAVALGGDMGTALVFAMIAVGIFWLAGMPRRYFVYAGSWLSLLAVAMISTNASRIKRIADFAKGFFSTPDAINPTQADFALWAFGSGGLSGTGPGTSVEKWPGNLAEAQTDYIFAVIGEEFGMFGCLVVLVMFALLGYGLIKVALHHPDRRARLTCGGVAIWLCGQAMANMFVVTGILPVFGVPLPFLSQGGSAVMACLLAIGFVVSCILSVPGMRDALRTHTRLARRAKAVVKG